MFSAFMFFFNIDKLLEYPYDFVFKDFYRSWKFFIVYGEIIIQRLFYYNKVIILNYFNELNATISFPVCTFVFLKVCKQNQRNESIFQLHVNKMLQIEI